ncbi:hypothetical protein JL_52 [Bacillus phage JL]|uniref:Uncharacterized protein n=1 Tax=Bacillus phage JL TaxID=1296655 RepID=S5MM41_9CAUD|nr:hypothetical protein AVV47_gp052 [Bacillus phage JL]AGR46740.1 hypothetical protein JL_52 [Bacillus phage JL]
MDNMKVVAPEEPIVSLIPAGSIVIDNGGNSYLVIERMAEEVGEHDRVILQSFNGQSRHEIAKNSPYPVTGEEVAGAVGNIFRVFTPEEYFVQLVKN